MTPPIKDINLRTVTDTSPYIYEFDYDTEPIRKVNRKLLFSQDTGITETPSNSN